MLSKRLKLNGKAHWHAMCFTLTMVRINRGNQKKILCAVNNPTSPDEVAEYSHSLRILLKSLLGHTRYELRLITKPERVEEHDHPQRIWNWLRGDQASTLKAPCLKTLEEWPADLLISNDLRLLNSGALPSTLSYIYFKPGMNPSIQNIVFPIVNPQQQDKYVENLIHRVSGTSLKIQLLHRAVFTEGFDESFYFSFVPFNYPYFPYYQKMEDQFHSAFYEKWIKDALRKGVQISVESDKLNTDFGRSLTEALRTRLFSAFAVDPHVMGSFFHSRMVHRIVKNTDPLIWMITVDQARIPLQENVPIQIAA